MESPPSKQSSRLPMTRTRRNSTACGRAARSKYGLGRKKMGHKAGQRALAAVVGDQLTGNWLACFEIDQDYYLVAHREGLILSDYDRLMSQEAEARDLFNDLFYSAEWDTIVAPSAWGIEGTEPTPIHGVIQRGKEHKLKAVGGLQAAMPLLVGVGVLGAAALGAMQFISADGGDFTYTPPEGLNEPMERLRGATEEAIRPVTEFLGGEVSEEPAEAEEPPEAPWLRRPNGVGLLLACPDDIKAAPVDVPGWETTSVLCGDSIRLTLERTTGNTLWAEKYFRDKGFSADFSNSVGSNTLAHSYPRSFVSEYAADFENPEIPEVARYLRYHFEENGLPLTFQVQNGSSSKIDRYYESAQFAFETGYEPSEFADLFSRLPGVLIDEISYDLASGVWNVSGTYYHKRANPIPPPQNDAGREVYDVYDDPEY
jgi:hypothetical protein